MKWIAAIFILLVALVAIPWTRRYLIMWLAYALGFDRM